MEALIRLYISTGCLLGLYLNWRFVCSDKFDKKTFKFIVGVISGITLLSFVFFLKFALQFEAFYWFLSFIITSALFHISFFCFYFMPIKRKLIIVDKLDIYGYPDLLKLKLGEFNRVAQQKIEDYKQGRIRSKMKLKSTNQSNHIPIPQSAEEKFEVLKQEIEGVMHKQQHLQGFIGYAIIKIQQIYLADMVTSFTMRHFNCETQTLEVVFTTREGTRPSDIPINIVNLISLSEIRGRAQLFSENLESHYNGHHDSYRDAVYSEYVTQSLVSYNGRPSVSVCLDVKGDAADEILREIYYLGVFDWLKLVVQEKLRIIGKDANDGNIDYGITK